MAMSEITETKPADDSRSKWIGIYIGILAAVLAICTLGGNNATKDAMKANIDATNLWGFFQAKNIRKHMYLIAADDLDLLMKANTGVPADAKTAMEQKIKAYRDTAASFEADNEKGEGLNQLFTKGVEIQKDRDVAFRKDPYFDAAQALLQIAIVLASVALIANANMLLYFSGGLGVIGTLLLLNGFTLVARLPFLG